jgi:hypothetical protein
MPYDPDCDSEHFDDVYECKFKGRLYVDNVVQWYSSKVGPTFIVLLIKI